MQLLINKRAILSLILVCIYVHSFAHGSLPHNNCDNHHSSGHHHHEHVSHESLDFEEHNCLSKGIMHSFVHLFENLAHSQFAHDEPMVVEANESKFLSLDFVFILFLPEQVKIKSLKTILEHADSGYQDFFLLNTSLRGPPSVV